MMAFSGSKIIKKKLTQNVKKDFYEIEDLLPKVHATLKELNQYIELWEKVHANKKEMKHE